MKEIKIKIGDHFIMLIWKSPNLTNILMEYFESFLSTESHHSDLVINIEDGYGVSFKEYEVEITKDHDQIFFHRADYLIKVGKEYKFATISVHNELALKHALMNLFSSFIVYHNWGLLIHSSCAIENGKAHVFAGQSGAGKSTAARLSYPRNLLSDEATLVKIAPEEVTIFNSPFRSELKAASYKGDVPLSSVLILYQALQNKRTKLEKSDALLYLMDKVFYWPHCHDETKGILRLMTLLVKQVPVYELHFQKNNTFWELIS